jgi:hypothetical protein
MNPMMGTPLPGPLPIGSADSADAEREKRFQRFADGLRWVVLGFNARNSGFENSYTQYPDFPRLFSGRIF